MPGSVLEVLGAATRLGLTSFGGPVAHLGYFRDEYVVRRKWVDERAYADLVALGQFLPGPASSQVGGLLVGLPLLRRAWPDDSLALFDSFFRAGSLVFGGGHVVLPLLQAEVVPPGWVTEELFVAGYGAAQAVPGPLFTFAAYLGAVRDVPPSGALGAAIALVAIFLPAFLLVVGVLPFWDALRRRPARYQRRGRGAAPRGALPAGVDERDRRAGRLRAGRRHVRDAGVLAGTGVACRRAGGGPGCSGACSGTGPSRPRPGEGQLAMRMRLRTCT